MPPSRASTSASGQPPIAGCFGCLILLSIPVSLLAWILVYANPKVVFKSWGPQPWSDEAKNSKVILDRYVAKQIPAAGDRIKAIRDIYSLNFKEHIIPFQKVSLCDPDDSVREVAVLTLLDYLNEFPNRLVQYNVFRIRMRNYVDIDFLKNMGMNDPSQRVRGAVATFWGKSTDFNGENEGKRFLRQMRAKEKDKDTLETIDRFLGTP